MIARLVPAVLLLSTLLLSASVGAQPTGTTGTPIGDWTDLRGTNYITCTATSQNNIHKWLSPGANQGTFDHRLIDAELKTLSLLGFDSIRIYGSLFAHATDRDDYLANLRWLAGACIRHNIRITFALWDSFGVDGLERPVLAAPRSHRSIRTGILGVVATEMKHSTGKPGQPAGVGGSWFASPGNRFLATHHDPRHWPGSIRERAELYLDDIARILGLEAPEAFLSYDVINEPDNVHLVAKLKQSELITIVANLTEFTRDRLARQHPGARYTVGTVDILLCGHVHQELLRRNRPGLDYLSFHDYLPVGEFQQRCSLAAAVGAYLKREVVCSEFYTAARQGHLPDMLGALHDAKIGGQMWGALEDRIFVVRYDAAYRRIFPHDPLKWWARDTGVVRAARDARQPGGWVYVTKNAAVQAAVLAWIRGIRPITLRWPTLQVTRQPGQAEIGRVQFTVEGPPGAPAVLLVGTGAHTQIPLPGHGVRMLDGTGLTVIPLGKLSATSTPGLGRATHLAHIPPSLVHRSIPAQAIVGNDYSLLSWEQSVATRLTAIKLVP